MVDQQWWLSTNLPGRNQCCSSASFQMATLCLMRTAPPIKWHAVSLRYLLTALRGSFYVEVLTYKINKPRQDHPCCLVGCSAATIVVRHKIRLRAGWLVVGIGGGRHAILISGCSLSLTRLLQLVVVAAVCGPGSLPVRKCHCLLDFSAQSVDILDTPNTHNRNTVQCIFAHTSDCVSCRNNTCFALTAMP